MFDGSPHEHSGLRLRSNLAVAAIQRAGSCAASGGTVLIVAAAKLCDDLVLDGQSDWRVPAPEELATWPALKTDSNAYITNPIYVPSTASPADGCTGNAHSCNITQYNTNSTGCAWQGVGFTGKFVCVRGTAAAGTTVAAYAAASRCAPPRSRGACEPCRSTRAARSSRRGSSASWWALRPRAPDRGPGSG